MLLFLTLKSPPQYTVSPHPHRRISTTAATSPLLLEATPLDQEVGHIAIMMEYSETISLFSISFSPLVMKLDKVSQNCKCSLLGSFVKVFTRIVNFFTPHTAGSELRLSVPTTIIGSHQSGRGGNASSAASSYFHRMSSENPWTIAEEASVFRQTLLSGKSLTLHTDVHPTFLPVAILLTWSFCSSSSWSTNNGGKKKIGGVLDVYTTVKRVLPHCQLNLAQTLALPSALAILASDDYSQGLPSSWSLLSVKSKVIG